MSMSKCQRILRTHETKADILSTLGLTLAHGGKLIVEEMRKLSDSSQDPCVVARDVLQSMNNVWHGSANNPLLPTQIEAIRHDILEAYGIEFVDQISVQCGFNSCNVELAISNKQFDRCRADFFEKTPGQRSEIVVEFYVDNDTQQCVFEACAQFEDETILELADLQEYLAEFEQSFPDLVTYYKLFTTNETSP